MPDGPSLRSDPRPSPLLRWRLHKIHCSANVSGSASRTAVSQTPAPSWELSGEAHIATATIARTSEMPSAVALRPELSCSSMWRPRGAGPLSGPITSRPLRIASRACTPHQASSTTAASRLSWTGRPSRASTTARASSVV